MKLKIVGLFTILCVVIVQCRKDEIPDMPEKESPVIFNPDLVPFDSLSSYRFFKENIKNQDPEYGVIPYDVITPLFTDYAKKKKFIWMPDSVHATYQGDHELLSFPNGTVLIKSFYYDRVQPNDKTRILETRLIYKLNDEWHFANYVWNEGQSEALLDLDGQFTVVEWIDENNEVKNVNYRIPSETECLVCHKTNEIPFPIGPKPQNLNRTYDYESGTVNQLDKFIDHGYLESGIPTEIETVANWDDTSFSLKDRVRAYLDINCGHCHKENSHCDYRAIRLAWNESSIDENLGVCVTPDEPLHLNLTHIIASENPENSVMYYRLNTKDESFRMPLLGRTLIHDEAVQLIEEFINSLNSPCN